MFPLAKRWKMRWPTVQHTFYFLLKQQSRRHIRQLTWMFAKMKKEETAWESKGYLCKNRCVYTGCWIQPSLDKKDFRGRVSVKILKPTAIVVMALRWTRLFHHHCAHSWTQGGISVCLPPILLSSFTRHSLFTSHSSSRFSFLLSFLSGVRCLVPPLGCSIDAGWRHSGLFLLLLMLMLKEAIGTCYFCC